MNVKLDKMVMHARVKQSFQLWLICMCVDLRSEQLQRKARCTITSDYSSHSC